MTVHLQYTLRLERTLPQIAMAIEDRLRQYLSSIPRIDRVAARAKSLERFLAKAAVEVDGLPKYSAPLHQVQDQVGARIITFYPQDVAAISEIVLRYFRAVETKLLIPENEWEFGYVGKHFILLIPAELVEDDVDPSLVPDFFELQIKTLFQHAWSEANHDLGYKPGSNPLTSDEKRRLAYTAAQAWGADRIFGELFHERGQREEHAAPADSS